MDRIVKFSDFVRVDEASSDCDITAQSLAKTWDKMYGENMRIEYPAFYNRLKKLGKTTKRQVCSLWRELYGEEFRTEYPAVYKELCVVVKESKESTSKEFEAFKKEVEGSKDRLKSAWKNKMESVFKKFVGKGDLKEEDLDEACGLWWNEVVSAGWEPAVNKKFIDKNDRNDDNTEWDWNWLSEFNDAIIMELAKELKLDVRAVEL